MKTCAFISFGCKVNQYDTQALREQCAKQGLHEAAPGGDADIYVINTCSVTEDADREALRVIRKIRRRHAQAQIIVTGCLVDRKLRTLEGVDLIVPSRQKHLIAGLAADATLRAAFAPCFTGGYTPLAVSEFAGHTRAFLKIQDGCEYACSFCKIPQVRGRAVSRPLPEILDEARRLIAGGYPELVLTGVSLGNYGREWKGQGPSLPDVLAELARVPDLGRLRISSVEPSDVTDRLLAVLGAHAVICRHLHLPLQSGSDRVLRMMRRHYSAAEYIALVARSQAAVPGLSLTTDVLVGFPGETDDDQCQTERVLAEVRPIRAHLFSYSPRAGTWAATMTDRVPRAVATQRMDRLRALQR